MTVAVLASEPAERQAFAEAIHASVRVHVLPLHPGRLESALVREDLTVAVIEHGPETDGLVLAADALRCRPYLHAVLVATGGSELLAASAIKQGIADYIPRGRLDRLGPSVRALLAARPTFATEQALRDSEENLRLVLSAARMGAWEWDLISGRMRTLMVDELYGLPPGTGDEQFESYARFVHPDDRDAYLARVQGILAGTDDFPLEYRIIRPDGQTRWMYSTGRVERVGTRPIFLRGVAMDRTEARASEARHHRAERLEGLGMVIGAVAHDLNNVLTPIQLSIDLLGRSRDEERRRALLDAMGTSVQRGVALLRQVLEFARGHDGERGLVDLGTVLAAVEADVRPVLPSGVIFQLPVVSGLAAVRGDMEQLGRLVRLLIDNALEAMPSGGRLTVEARNTHFDEAEARTHPGAAAGPHVLIRVADTGEGIAPGELGRVFDPFFTTRKAQGHSGLGLSVVRGIARRHQALLDVSSDPGRGTIFRVWIPAVTPATGEDRGANPHGG
jgi:signal transduction histidine kinase